MNHSCSWACRFCHHGLTAMGPCSRAFGVLGPGRFVYLSALPFARYLSCSEWLSWAEGLWWGAITAGHSSYLPGHPHTLRCQMGIPEIQK